jgi:Rrf2 family transcriptional regulator, cysteine metabolism repressor
MNVSVKGEYALQALFDLTAHGRGEPVKIAEIAMRQKIPQKFLELILASLKQGGFVESRRGAEGGYLLARAPGSITAGEVLRFIEGNGGDRARGRQQADSPFSPMWKQVEEAISGVLDHTSLAEIYRAWSEKRAYFVPNWEI